MIAVILIVTSMNGHFGKIVSVNVFKERGLCEVVKKVIDDESRLGVYAKCVEVKK